ncbi:MAG: cohesin domain-containing protein [Clostridia bacterium]|nr:cohesin domain-containing protein [Clostridia bacterium]
MDKTNAAVGQIITASVKVNNIIGLASAYQLNITYDPTVLQAVNPTTGAAYTNTTKPSNGNIFLDADVVAAAHDISKGILNFGKSFTAERPSEPTGTLAVIGFKVLKQTATTVKFEKSLTMPNSIDGTLLYSKPGTPNLTGYTVKQPPSINGTVVVTPTPTTTTKPTNTPTPTTTTKPTNTPTPTPDNNVKAWAPYTNYTTGTLVTYAGSKYQCVQSHQSLPGWEPANVPALWRKVTAR